MTRSLLLALLLAAGAPVWAAADRYVLVEVNSVPASPAAQAVLAEINAAWLVLGPQPQEFWDKLTRTQAEQMREDALQKVRKLAVAYAQAHPADPLRWVGIYHMLLVGPEFITGFKPGLDQAKGRSREFWIVDESAKAAWAAELTRYAAALEAAPDVPWEIHERRASVALVTEIRGLGKEPAAIAAYEAKLAPVAKRFPDGRLAFDLLVGLHHAAISAGGAEAEALWIRHADSPNRLIADRARAELRKIEAGRKGLTMAFTAVDGREVDLAKLRGKVVLVDFWATWCGPCIAELPNVKKVYAAYHDKGFAVVGISLESANLKSGDTPEQTAAKLEKAKKVLTDFTAKEDMPWPQYFDGKHWKNNYAEELAITGIPAMFLLDRDGKIVSTDARGEKLEAQVKRLLGL